MDQSSASPLKFWERGKKRLLGALGLTPSNGTITETLEELLEETPRQEFVLDQDQKVLLTNIFKLSSITAEDVMVPRADIIAVEVSTEYDQLVGLLAESAHSRLPVYRKTLDDILGLVHIKDVLTTHHKKEVFKLKHIVRPVLFVVGATPVLDILLKMRLKQTHLALVVDEFGGVDGLVTIEDIVEQIVGEIDDEHDVDEEAQFQMEPDGSIIADARLYLEDFEAWAGTTLPEEDFEDIDTLGGFVCAVASRVPDRGEIITFEDRWEFEILEADPRKIKRLRVRRLTPATESAKNA